MTSTAASFVRLIQPAGILSVPENTEHTVADLKNILSDIAKSIVDKKDSVVIIQTEDGDNITLELSVAPDDMGKVIGRHGRIAKAIRMVMKAAANKSGKKVSVEIK